MSDATSPTAGPVLKLDGVSVGPSVGSPVGLVVAVGLRALSVYASTVGFSLIGNRVLTEVRADLYRHLHSLSMSYHNKARKGDLTVRVIGDKKHAILGNHGVLAMADTVAEAFDNLYYLERACQTLVEDGDQDQEKAGIDLLEIDDPLHVGGCGIEQLSRHLRARRPWRPCDAAHHPEVHRAGDELDPVGHDLVRIAGVLHVAADVQDVGTANVDHDLLMRIVDHVHHARRDAVRSHLALPLSNASSQA